MITLENVEIGYSQKNILASISHTFASGKISVIIGENGVGKSTLIKALTRQVKPLSGKIYLDKIPLFDYKLEDFAKKIAYLPQNPLSPADITVRQLCLASRFPYKKKWGNYSKEDGTIVEEMLQLVGLSKYIDTNLGILSGGLKQRAWFAMILAQQTDIVILDEPTSFLDIAYQLELLDLLQQLNSQFQKTIIMILHDINHALRYADEIIALRKSQLPMIAKPENLDVSFFEKTLHIQSYIAKDPYHLKPYAIPLVNTL